MYSNHCICSANQRVRVLPFFDRRDSCQKDELKMKDHLPEKDFEDLLMLVQQKHTLIDKEILKG